MREIKAAGKLSAEVEGDIEDVDGVLKISRIKIHYRLAAPEGSQEKVQRALTNYADKCPAYQSVKSCIDCNWDLELVAE